MSWKEKTVIRILLLIAKWISEGDAKTDLQHLTNHINLYTPERP